jgi:hypothetical protein
MKLTIHKHKNNTGKYFHKAPHGSDIRNTRSVTCKEITKYIEGNHDFGCMNYISKESCILTLRNLDIVYVYEDLY